MAVDRHHPEDSHALRRGRAGSLVDACRGGSFDRVLRASPGGPGAVCPGDRLPCFGDHRPGMGTGGPGTKHRLAQPDQERDAAGSAVECGCSASVERANRQASALLLHASRRADPVGTDQLGLALGAQAGGDHRTSAFTTCGIPGRLGIGRRERPATSSRTWVAGSRGRWWTAMPSLRRRTCWRRRLESRRGVTRMGLDWHVYVTVPK